MRNLDIKFIALAALALTGGVGMGIYMGIVHDFALSPVHAHLNLVGWASLALFGIVYKIYPQLQAGWAAKAHFVLAAPAAVVFPFGIYLSMTQGQPVVAIVASLAWGVGSLLFLGQMLGLAFGGSRTAEPALMPAE